MQSLLRTHRVALLSRPVFSPSSSLSSLHSRSFSSSSPRLDTPPKLSDGEQLLKDKIEAALDGAKVDVQDVSGGCGSFYAISIAHSSFKGLSMIKQHRVVNELLKDEIAGMHGLQLKTTAA